MKIGIRKPSLKKSFRARTTGKLNRKVKNVIVPAYGKKGMGWIKNPKKALYNKVYNKTSVKVFPSIVGIGTAGKKRTVKPAKRASIKITGYAGRVKASKNKRVEVKTAVPLNQEDKSMKICKYCGQSNEENAIQCRSCGNKDFSHKCLNCGYPLDESLYCPNCGYVGAGVGGVASKETPVDKKKTAKKRKIWLWILGWLLLFPLPLTIILLRKKEMKPGLKYGIIAAAWSLLAVYTIVGTVANSVQNSTDQSQNKSAYSHSEKTNTEDIDRSIPGENGEESTADPGSNEGNEVGIRELSFSDMEDISLKTEEIYEGGSLRVTGDRLDGISQEDLVFFSDNPEVATIAFTGISSTSYSLSDLTFSIAAVGPGETTVYVTTVDGSVSSEKIKVSVKDPVVVEQVVIAGFDKGYMAIGESAALSVEVLPEDAEDRSVVWTSNNRDIISVDSNGKIDAVGIGTALITATSSNGISSSLEIKVDGSKRIMALKVSDVRHDNNNIGNEWSYIYEVNGERASNRYTLSLGDTVTLYAKLTESDKKPDIGEATKSHVITEEDLKNGFTVSMDVYVTENAGANSGKSAHFIVSFSFKPV